MPFWEGVMALEALAELQAELAIIQTAIRTVITTGQQYSMNTGQGSQSVTRASLPELRKYEAEIRRRIARLTLTGVESGEVIR